ncbi:MAG: DUF1810 domain-containing protein [Gammaproteobacteria bacterium]|nr:DUF1810 domain-containing protein [Gammaproteobacteria bacterium]
MSEAIDLDRFKRAQLDIYEQVVSELKAGRKRSHWIWFIFPQIQGLGTSLMNERYAIRSFSEARAYLDDPVLYDRLIECCDLLLMHASQPIDRVLGYPDNLKLKSSMTLFSVASPEDPIFREVLDAFFSGATDLKTLQKLEIDQ